MWGWICRIFDFLDYFLLCEPFFWGCSWVDFRGLSSMWPKNYPTLHRQKILDAKFLGLFGWFKMNQRYVEKSSFGELSQIQSDANQIIFYSCQIQELFCNLGCLRPFSSPFSLSTPWIFTSPKLWKRPTVSMPGVSCTGSWWYQDLESRIGIRLSAGISGNFCVAHLFFWWLVTHRIFFILFFLFGEGVGIYTVAPGWNRLDGLDKIMRM